MYFKNSKDNKNLIDKLENVIKNHNVSHAYIFEGDNCVDKKSFAESFVKGILCVKDTGENCGDCSICSKIDHGNHEDLIYISADGDSIKDSKILKMQERLKTKPFGERNIVIIEQCDKMTLRAQNRLLKTLEEPPGKSVIILLSENIENLAQTIQSRCVKYRINHFGSEGYDFMISEVNALAEAMIKGAPFYFIKEKLDKLVKDKNDAAAFLDSLQVIYRNMLVDKRQQTGISLIKDEELIENIYAAEDARKQIKQGVSLTYALRNLILKIGG